MYNVGGVSSLRTECSAHAAATDIPFLILLSMQSFKIGIIIPTPQMN